VNEPEFVNELVSLLQCGDEVPEDIRVYAIRALAAQAQDRPRQSNVLNVVSAGGHRGILPSLVQKALSTTCSISFAEAILFLVTVLVSSSAGCAALREAGLIPTLLPLLKDTNPQHIDLVISAVHILEALMDYSHSAGTLFRDLGGLDDTIMRLQFEVTHVGLQVKDENRDMEVTERAKSNIGESSTVLVSDKGENFIPYRLRLLLKALLLVIHQDYKDQRKVLSLPVYALSLDVLRNSEVVYSL
jgi:E3 ubiquitin-protein ligase HUWE1